jgi:hypothetical protein
VKTDASGNRHWTGPSPGGGNDEDYVRSVVQTNDGGYVFAGYTRGPPYPSFNFYSWLVKTNSAGNAVWNRIYTSLGQSYVYSMVKTSDGGFALAGQGPPLPGFTDMGAMLVKTDASGNIVWYRIYGSSGESANSVVQTSDGGYALAGSGLWKTDSSGNLQWSKATATVNSIVQTSDGGYALLGISAPSPGYQCFTLYKKDSNGNPDWTSVLSYSIEGATKSLVQTPDGGYALAGITQDLGGGLSDGYLIKTDSNGVQEWWDYFGGVYDDGVYCVVKTSDGGLALAGYTKSYTNGGYDMWLIKMPALPSTYTAIIWAWDALDPKGWIAEPITMDGVPTGYTTPYTFPGLTGTHTFTVPNTDVDGRAFSSWDTGETSTTITVGSGGTHTAQYASYVATIWAWDVEGWIAEPITMDGAPTGFSTPHAFTGLTGTHTFTVPSTDVLGYPFSSWDTGETSTTITVTQGGTHTAQYRPPSFSTRTWYWTDDTVIKSVAAGDVDGDAQKEIVTGGYYWDGARYTSQLCVWSGTTLSLENVRTWYWTSTTLINSVAVGDVDADGQVEIVTGGYYRDSTRSYAQLCVWTGATLVLENVRTWYWTGDTEIVSLAVADVDADSKAEIVTGGSYNDGLYKAQLCVWDGSTLVLENVRTWYWTSFTYINSVVVGDVDGDSKAEIVTGGAYWDGYRFNAQLCNWDAATLAFENVRTWYWTGSTIIYSVGLGDVDGDSKTEIVTAGNYNDGIRSQAQLCVWDGSTLAFEKVRTWYWTGDTSINSVAVRDTDSDGKLEIVTGGEYNDGSRTVAQFCVWDSATLALENVKTWYWTDDTAINSVAVGDVNGDAQAEIVTGGSYYDGTRQVAQLCTWS